MSGDDDIRAFLMAKKVADFRWRWTVANHPDYAAARSRLHAVGTSLPHGRLIVQAHLNRMPYKYSFSIVFRKQNIFRLDVEPGLTHRRTTILKPINGTHWQMWPDMGCAEPDDRNLGWTGWLDSFLRRAKIELRHPLLMPPFKTKEQLGLEI
ncbi:hypothetical protein [uncultured Nisaea sp.]|uniref:hypothetical protein n=1 Tax=uncultured Nisaea sp. TaxID=538215 RepID=UPI0030ED187C|tara:strand:+ start:1629 stop:2084 length:456 start_codon:yes stop_codon:yes gene_type:complete